MENSAASTESSTESATESSTESSRVLLVDDDVKLCELLQESLKREGLESSAIHDGTRGLEAAQSGKYAIVVLDVMLPGLGGLDVLRRLRASDGPQSHLPVLMLTARGDELDKVLGLELGADDYLPKPFSARELVARLRAILRRTAGHSPAPTIANSARKVVRVADLELDGAARQVRRGGAIIELTGAEFDLLEALLRAAGDIVTREVISQSALGRALMPFDRSIDVHISNLRRKLGPDAAGQERIKAVRGVGYIYVKHREE